MKKNVLRIMALFLTCIILLCGCSPIVEESPETVNIYASFYPIYALTEMIVKDIPDLELHCLVQPQDGCLRSYSLSDWDLYLLGYSADALIMGGSGLESFSNMVNGSDLAIGEVLHGIELHEGKSLIDEESHFNGANPHLYMSVDGGMRILENITAAMSILDARYSSVYEANLSNALSEMKTLAESIRMHTSHLSGRKVILMNEALVYAAEDYGLKIDACYERESGTAVYNAEIDQMLDTLSKSEAKVVLIEKQAPESLIKTLNKAGYTVAKLDILSTKSEKDGVDGYFEALSENAKAVERAFSEVDGK